MTARHLCIIPARGGSRRIPRKNIKPFAGQPMLSFALQAAQQSGLFAHVVVSTDDDEIARIARQYGAQVPFVRPPELSNDVIGVVPVLQHAIDACARQGMAFEHVCCIFPCVPLLESADLARALASMAASQAEFAFTVSEFPAAIQRALRKTPDGAMQSFYPEYLQTRTQDLEPAFYDAGQFYWGTRDAWLSGRSPHQGGQACVIPGWRAVDIDTPDDWQRAELIYAAARAGKEC